MKPGPLLVRLASSSALVALLLGVVVGAPGLSTAAPVAAATVTASAAPVAPELWAKAAVGEVRVVAVTRVAGATVAGRIERSLPRGSASAVAGGGARQVALTVDGDGLEALAGSPDVVQVVEDKPNRVTADAWTTAIGLPSLVTSGSVGTGRTVAVLDSGVQADHPYLGRAVVAEACFSTNAPGVQSLCDGGAVVQQGPGAAAPCAGIAGCAHGTHVAGIAAGGPVTSPSELFGVASGASLVAVKVFSRATTSALCGGAPPCLVAFDSDLAEALDWLRGRLDAGDPAVGGLDAVNLSLGGGLYGSACDSQSPTVAAAISELRARGVATVVASGNGGSRGAMSSPACISSAVSVGATSGAGLAASYANIDADTSLLAPGTSITSSVPPSSYLAMTGTSMASPMVAGAMALLRERSPAASVSELVTRLRGTGELVTTSSFTVPSMRVDRAVATGPERPAGVTVAPGAGQLTVSWAGPSSLGAPVPTYTATANPGGAACTTATTSCTITGLTDGTTYTVTVSADGPEAGPASVPVSGTPRRAPDAPGAVSGVPGAGRVTVSWGASPFDGGSAVTGYRAVASPGGASCATAGALSCVVTGLDNWSAYTFTVTATNAAGTGAPSAASAAVVPRLPVGGPVGSLDSVTAGVGTVAVSGWAIDPDTPSPIEVHLYVDGAALPITAAAGRPDVGAAFPGYGPDHGYRAVLGAVGGTRTVCAYAIDVGPGTNTLLGCRTVSVPTGPPLGALEAALPGPGTITVSGWALDPDQTAPVQVHLYVDGAAVAVTADQPRADVGAFFVPYGPDHGWTGTVGAASGAHNVCAYAINVGPGANSALGCRSVVVGGSPFGSLDSVVRNLDGTLSASGWAIDPDTASPVTVVLYVDAASVAVGAGGARPDVGEAFPAYGASHGYAAVLGASSGPHRVCAYALNRGLGADSLLGCRRV